MGIHTAALCRGQHSCVRHELTTVNGALIPAVHVGDSDNAPAFLCLKIKQCLKCTTLDFIQRGQNSQPSQDLSMTPHTLPKSLHVCCVDGCSIRICRRTEQSERALFMTVGDMRLEVIVGWRINFQSKRVKNLRRQISNAHSMLRHTQQLPHSCHRVLFQSTQHRSGRLHPATLLCTCIASLKPNQTSRHLHALL